MSDVALRKKKNADAQAAFRARRANYIATLEETVTSLETIILQLQDSCREARKESEELKQRNESIRHEFREREKYWRALAERSGTQFTDPSPSMAQPPPSPTHSQPGQMSAQASSSHVYGHENIGYRAPQDPSASVSSFDGQNYVRVEDASLQYPSEREGSATSSSQVVSNQRPPKYSQFPFTMSGNVRDSAWSGVAPAGTTLEAGVAASYMFSASSRSSSPPPSTPSSSNTSVASQYPYAYHEGAAVGQHDTDFSYRRQSGGPGGDIAAVGGGSEISFGGAGSDALRYRLGARPVHDPSTVSIMGPIPASGHSPGNERGGSSEDESSPIVSARSHSRRGTAPSQHSRSPSPGGESPISGTLAVLKAQAFGALRRTRTRSKKTESASRAAMDIVQAGVGPSPKRQRLSDEEDKYDAT